MSQKLFILLCFTVLSINYSASCQEINLETIENLFSPSLSGEIFNSPSGYLGSQYYFEEWLNGSVTLLSGEKAINTRLRYNGLLDELIWMKTPSFQQVKLDKNLIKEFSLNKPDGEILTFKRLSVNLPPFNQKTEIFAQSLYESQISLYAFRRISIIGRVIRKMETGNFEFSEIEPSHLYFITSKDAKSFYLSKISKRNISRLFPEFKEEINKIYKNSRGKTEEERFIIVVKLLNDIMGIESTQSTN